MQATPRTFGAFILTNGRPDNCVTYETLRKSGYTGRIVLVVDNLDKTRDLYVAKYGDEVVIFDKTECAKTVDRGDNKPGLGTAMFARNASFDIARDLGLSHFVQLDDDYTSFQYRFDERLDYNPKTCRNLDRIFEAILDYLDAAPIDSIAMAQGGDFIGGSEASLAKAPKIRRKCMNSWFCRTDRRFDFSMRMNDDVTTYVLHGMRGRLFFTTNQVNLNQLVTQSAPGGMTELYRDSGTYMKTFYTVMAQPSSVKIGVLRGQTASRIHHMVAWKNTVPMILRETWRKS
jgi:hypothetical protein